MSIQVECINKRDRQSAHERIENIGGTNPDGTRWKIGQADAVVRIDTGVASYHVDRPTGDRVDVVVAVSAAGNKYIKTTADGDQPNNLLSLPECP